ncbi:MAG: hypothetical protein ACPHIB_00980 [Thalassobaculaceae bacterium]
MNTTKSEWERLRDQYPALENEFDREERTAFDRWVEGMGFDGLIQLTGKEENEQSKESN